MIDKFFSEGQGPLRFEDLCNALLEASDVLKSHSRIFDIIAYLFLLASGKRINPQDQPYFHFLAEGYDFRAILKRMREDSKVPCAGETILDEVLTSK